MKLISVTSYGRHGISDHQWLDCLFNILFRLTTKKISKLCINDPLWGANHQWAADSLHKGQVMQKTFPCPDGLKAVRLRPSRLTILAHYATEIFFSVQPCEYWIIQSLQITTTPPEYILARGWFNIKILSYQYRKSHCGDKTILWSSYLHNWISYTGKTFLYWIRALDFTASSIVWSVDCWSHTK